MKSFRKLLRKSENSFLKTNPHLSFLVKNTQIGNGVSKLSDLKWPIFRNARFDQALTKFMYSFKNVYSENINGNSACFLIGPTKCGKSWYLRYNLRKFQNSAIKPLVFHFNAQGMKSFEMFLHSFETVIIDELVSQSQEKSLTVDQLLKVAFRFYDKNLFEH